MVGWVAGAGLESHSRSCACYMRLMHVKVKYLIFSSQNPEIWNVSHGFFQGNKSGCAFERYSAVTYEKNSFSSKFYFKNCEFLCQISVISTLSKYAALHYPNLGYEIVILHLDSSQISFNVCQPLNPGAVLLEGVLIKRIMPDC